MAACGATLNSVSDVTQGWLAGLRGPDPCDTGVAPSCPVADSLEVEMLEHNYALRLQHAMDQDEDVVRG